jgi:hypothetical protein
MVGERDRGLLELRGAFDQRVDLARAVKQRVLGMDVQVDAGRGHAGGGLDQRKRSSPSIGIAPDT